MWERNIDSMGMFLRGFIYEEGMCSGFINVLVVGEYCINMIGLEMFVVDDLLSVIGL